VFDGCVRGGGGVSSCRDSDAAEEPNDREGAGRSPVICEPRNPFAAPAAASASSPEPRPNPPVPHDGGLIFQVPKAELAEVVKIEDDDCEDWDDSLDDDDDPRSCRRGDDDDEAANSPRRRCGGRGR